MEKKVKLRNNIKTYLIYTILFCIISLVVFAVFIKMDKGFIWQSDGFKQHFAILYDFNEMMRNIFQNGFPMFSWNMGLGLDVIGQYSYYVIGDPFAYISLLFPMQYLETIYSVLIILRIYCVGLAFIAYCKYHGKSRINTIIGAIIYSFCGFILYAGIRHPYFTNAAIFLPLTLIGIEKLLKENKKSYLILIVFLSAISNYYFFYMIAIIDFIYAIIKYIVEYNNGVKDFIKKIFQAVLCYTIGILMAAVILLPTIYAFFNSARTSYEQGYLYQSNFYNYLFMGLISMRFKNWTVIGVASIVILMISILFTKIKKQKEAKSFAIIFIITTVMLLIPFVASLMNGLSFPSNRWVFSYSFVLAYIVTICFDSIYSKKQILLMTVVLTVYAIIGVIITKLEIRRNLDFYGAIALAYAILAVWVFNYFKVKKIEIVKLNCKKIFKYTNSIIIMILIINVGGVAFALYSSIGKNYASEFLDNNSVFNRYATLNGKIENYDKAIEYIKQNDNSFYRIAKNDTTNQNVSLIYNYNPIQTFLSIGNGAVFDLSCELEDNCYSTTQCIDGMDRRTKITTLLGTKYFVCDKEDENYVPFGYELYYEKENTQIYINKNYVPLGVVYDNYILQEEFEELGPLEKEDILLNSAVVESEVSNIKKGSFIKNDTNIFEQSSYDTNYIKKENILEKNLKNIEKQEENSNNKMEQEDKTENDENNDLQQNNEKIIEISNIKSIDYTIENKKVMNNSIETKKKNESITLEINELTPDTEIYLSIKNIKYKDGKDDFKITTNFNEVKGSEELLDFVSSAYYMENKNILINLGVVTQESENEVKVTFNNKGNYTWDSMEILEVSMNDYEEEIDKLKQNEMTNIKYGNNFVEGTVNSETNGILQISTSYSDGWKVWIDGEEKEVIRVNEGFIGTVVEAGDHEVRFEYETPYLKMGLIFSVIGFAIFISLIFIDKKL